ncbi:MAG: hypothetical protein WDO70_04075 [Alphaproteobacteria bacterium]
MTIECDPSLQSSPGDFGIVVDGATLRVPQELYGFLREMNLHDPADIVSSIETFPGGFADALGWNNKQVKAALRLLTPQLEGLVHPDILLPRIPYQYATGVVPLEEAPPALPERHLKLVSGGGSNKPGPA